MLLSMMIGWNKGEMFETKSSIQVQEIFISLWSSFLSPRSINLNAKSIWSSLVEIYQAFDCPRNGRLRLNDFSSRFADGVDAGVFLRLRAIT